MLLIDGQKSELDFANFTNLDQVFIKVMEEGLLRDRVVTDVFVNDEPFSEIYPHQAEDIDATELKTVEIRTLPVGQVAVEITRELYKVVTLMGEGAGRVAELFRQADDAEALETYQDLVDVTRDFLGMIGVLRSESAKSPNSAFDAAADDISNLFSEMLEVLENEDWILLADLLEYEFIPAMGRFKTVIGELQESFETTVKE